MNDIDYEDYYVEAISEEMERCEVCGNPIHEFRGVADCKACGATYTGEEELYFISNGNF